LTVALSLIALLAFGSQALASGNNLVYSGPVDQAAQPHIPQAHIDLYVHVQHHRNGKVTVRLPVVNVFNVYAACQDGTSLYPGINHGAITKADFEDFKVKGRSINGTGGTQEGSIRMKLIGTIPKHGAASGTLDLSEDTGDPQFGHCDSGVLSWTAARQ
jgi:hypothetical protein